MNNQLLIQDLSKITKSFLLNEDMKSHTTFRVGGPADIFVCPQSKEEAAEIVRLLLAHKEPFTIIGNGSNLLVSDKGYRGTVICMASGMDYIDVKGNVICAGAGALLSKVANTACDNSLTGLVFASGIPGSIGGAVYMNAGAYGGQMADVITQVELLDYEKGEIITKDAGSMEFGYRTSVVKNNPYMVLSATLQLDFGKKEQIKSEMDELALQRRSKQPLEYPSAGSTFKRPEGYFAGKLIEDAGLKGYRVGGAVVSQKHSGFVVNDNNATCEDIVNLIKYVKKTVKDRFGVTLEPEVCMLGEGIDL